VRGSRRAVPSCLVRVRVRVGVRVMVRVRARVRVRVRVRARVRARVPLFTRDLFYRDLKPES